MAHGRTKNTGGVKEPSEWMHVPVKSRAWFINRRVRGRERKCSLAFSRRFIHNLCRTNFFMLALHKLLWFAIHPPPVSSACKWYLLLSGAGKIRQEWNQMRGTAGVFYIRTTVFVPGMCVQHCRSTTAVRAGGVCVLCQHLVDISLPLFWNHIDFWNGEST